MPPIIAVLGGFGSAQLISRDFPESAQSEHEIKDILGKNILQFAFLLNELIKSCDVEEGLAELREVMQLCFEQDPDVRPKAPQLRDLLEDLRYRNDIWDTNL